MLVDINYWAVLIAAILFMIIGAFWYSPLAFGKIWMNALGKRQEEIQGGRRSYAVSFTASLLMAFVLAHLVYYTSAETWQQALQVGFWIWLGFVATTNLITTEFDDRPLKVYMIFAGYTLVSLMAMSLLLVYWQ